MQPIPCSTMCRRGQLKCDGTRAETRFRLSAKRTSPFKSAGASVQSTTGSRGVRISGSNAWYTTFRGSVKGTGYPLYSPVSPSLPLLCVTVCHHISTEVYKPDRVLTRRRLNRVLVQHEMGGSNVLGRPPWRGTDSNEINQKNHTHASAAHATNFRQRNVSFRLFCYIASYGPSFSLGTLWVQNASVTKEVLETLQTVSSYSSGYCLAVLEAEKVRRKQRRKAEFRNVVDARNGRQQ